MLVSGLPPVLRNNLKVLYSVGIANDGCHHLGTLVHAVVVKNIFPVPAITPSTSLALRVPLKHLDHHLVGAQRGYSRSLAKHRQGRRKQKGDDDLVIHDQNWKINFPRNVLHASL